MLVTPSRLADVRTLPTIGVPVLVTGSSLDASVRGWLQRNLSIGRVRVVPGMVSAAALVGARNA